MSDLISRQAAIEAMATWDWQELYLPINFKQLLDDLPSAQPEQKTGKWTLDPNGMDWNIPAWRCSECGFVASHIGVGVKGLGNNPMNWAGSNFCPECGTEMEE